MNHLNILKRSFNITWKYHVLWIFGALLALGASGSNGGGGGPAAGSATGGGDIGRLPGVAENLLSNVWLMLGVIAGILLIVFLITTVVSFLRYLSRSALLKMVADYELTDERRSFGWGLRAAWSRSTWRLFLIDLAIGLPVFVVFAALFVVLILPLVIFGGIESLFLGAFGNFSSIGLLLLAVTTLGMLFFWGLALLLVTTFLSVACQFFWRACVFEGLGVRESIRKGWSIMRNNLRDVALMWIVMLGINIGWGLLLVPVLGLALTIGVFIGGIPFGLLALISILGASVGDVFLVVVLLIGIAILFLIVGASATFLQGLMEVFSSTTWTLTYRELQVLGQDFLEDREMQFSV